MTSTSAKPTAKVAAGGLGGLIAALILWGIDTWGITLPPEVLAYVPVAAAFIASYMTRDRLVELGRLARDARAGATRPRHADNGDGIPDNLEVTPAAEATSDTKSDAAGEPTSSRALEAKQTDDWEG